MLDIETKTCTKCGKEMPATWDYFGKGRGGRIESRCRECRRQQCADWYARNRESQAAKQRVYYATHREEAAAYYQENAEKIRAYHRQYCKDNPEWAATAARNRRALRRAAAGTHTKRDVVDQLVRQAGHCYWCGSDLQDGYHVDHVIPLSKGGSNGPENLVISCASCNCKKGARLPYEFSDRLC